MLRLFYTVIITILSSCLVFAQNSLQLPLNKGNANSTPTYEEIINFYDDLQKKFKQANLKELGLTDVGLPLHVFEIKNSSKGAKINLLINNGIHPGEPDGIDASMMLALNILEAVNNENITTSNLFKNNYSFNELKNILNYVNIYIIPVYNVDGALRRNSFSRANQNGPEEYGFRANSRNLDLNRDFIKQDSKNAKEFSKIFQQIKPHIFIDNHTSNGADYQHILTYIATQKDKLNKHISQYQYNYLIPSLDSALIKFNFKPVPYVNNWSNTPETGWAAFYESPRFATGYSTLFNTIGFTVETHMLKKYSERVESTYAFLYSILNLAKKDHQKITECKLNADRDLKSQNIFYLNWKLDSSRYKMIEFNGYEAEYKKSEIGNYDRLYYNRMKPFSKMVKFYDTYMPIDSVQKPKAYIIPFAWTEVIDRMHINGVKFEKFKNDTVLDLKTYYIKNYHTSSRAYEGHYLHSNTKVESKTMKIKIRKGDFIIYTNQLSNRFIIETLEPQSIDSYFNWNFFDSMLQQKEYFSDYIFEETAKELLAKDPEIKKAYENKLKLDPEFSKNKDAVLDFIYKLSPYYESSHLQYPIYRLEE